MKAAREYAPTQSSRVQSSPNQTRQDAAFARHTMVARRRAHRQRQVESHESCRVDSIGATCFVFVSRITGIGCAGCYCAFGNGCTEVILLVQVHQAICDASQCEQRTETVELLSVHSKNRKTSRHLRAATGTSG